MEGRLQTPFTWEQKPESGWIEGLSICLSLKKLKNFLQRLTNPPAPPLSLPLTFFFLLDPLFPPRCLSCFSLMRPPLPLSIALSFYSMPPPPPYFIFCSLFYLRPSNLSFWISASLTCMMFGFFQAFSGLSGSLTRPPLKFWFDCRHNTRRHQCVSSLYSPALAYNETDPIHENDSWTIALAHSIFSFHIK